MPDSEKRAQGKAKFEEVMRFPLPPVEGDLFVDQTVEHLFADVWARPGLGVRERRLVTLTILMSFGHEATLAMHLRAAMKSGDLRPEEIDELVVHVAHYAGWPRAAVASQVVRQVRAER
jgi:4-carboxymuconolactone decarboxylase